jgi:hypothetical protein
MELKYPPLMRNGLLRLATLLVLLGSCVLLRAAQFGDFTYTDYGSYVVITDYPTSATGTVIVPAAINGKPVKRIGSGAFSYCSSLTGVTLPSSITQIEDDAFSYCNKLTTINFPSGLTSIGSSAFLYCDSITTVSLPSSLTSLGKSAFSRCAKLASISVNASNPMFASVGGVLFNKSRTLLIQFPSGKGGSYSVPATVTEIGSEAFFNANLTSIKVSSGLTKIADLAFYACSGLTKITLPSTLKSVGNGAFAYSGLTAATLPSSVTSIGNRAYGNCYSLKAAQISANVTSLGASVFGECGLLDAISVSPANPKYSEKDGVVFDKSGATLLLFPSGRAGHYTVPYGVTSIADGAFSGCRILDSVTLPAGLNSIGNSAFMLCTSMTSVQLPAGLVTIGSSAFWTCSSLKDITIPASVTSVGFYAFYGCSSLARAHFRGNAPVMGSVVFTSTPSTFGIHYYQNRTGFDTPEWKSFKLVNLGNLIETPADIVVHSRSGVEFTSGGSSEDFGSPLSGESVARTFTIRNAGETPLIGIAATCEGPQAADFILGAPAATSVPPGGSTTITVTFQATSGGDKEAFLKISSNDADENPFEVALLGDVRIPMPEIVVMQPAGSSLADGTGKKSFGTVKIGSKGSTKTFTIKNTGTADLSGLSILKSGSHKSDFIVGPLQGSTLMPGASMTFKVTFKPKTKGTRSAALRIKSNDADENPFDVKLTGMGALP